MKLYIPLLILIILTLSFSSCSKKEESTTATATAVPAGGTGTTAGGTIEGNTDFTGTFHLWRSGNGDPSGGCIDNEPVFSNFGIHTSVKGWKRDVIVTSSTAFTIAETFYSDTTCSTVIGYNHKLYKSVKKSCGTVSRKPSNITKETG